MQTEQGEMLREARDACSRPIPVETKDHLPR